MILASTPWRLAVSGGVGIVAGVALVSIDWTIAALAAFAGLALVARGALHLVTAASFLGLAGAFSILEVGGDVGVGMAALAWPDPTVRVVALLFGLWAIVHAIAAGTVGVTTRSDRRSWPLSVVFAIVAVVLGTILVARRDQSVGDAADLIGLLALLEGTREVFDAAVGHRHARRSRATAMTDSAQAAS